MKEAQPTVFHLQWFIQMLGADLPMAVAVWLKNRFRFFQTCPNIIFTCPYYMYIIGCWA